MEPYESGRFEQVKIVTSMTENGGISKPVNV